MDKIDVVIVGAGLSGLACAYKLAESEEKFADIIWQDEPIGSGDNTLKKVCNIYSTKKMM